MSHSPALSANNPRLFRVLEGPSRLAQEVEAFLLDRRAGGCSPRTIQIYQEKLGILLSFLEGQGVREVQAITPDLLRRFLLAEAEHRTPGGVHVLYRVARTFLRWWEAETEPEGWRNPITRVAAPKVPEEPLEPVPLHDLQTMLATCKARTFNGDRDRAILLALLDTGCRRGEFAALNLGDLDLGTGTATVRQGKGGKRRVVFLGRQARRAIVRYLRHRKDAGPGEPLWVTSAGTRLAYGSVREVIRRRARAAGVSEPSLHSFRRACALLMLRSGADLVSLQRLLGHSNLSVLQRYLKQTSEDLAEVHAQHSPVDHWL